MTKNIALATLKSTGSSTKRTFADRFSDVINVRDYGAVGDGSTNDSTAVQAALDAAFTTSGTANGATFSYRNKPVYFPCGNYNLGSVVTVTDVVGGHIFGDSAGSTQLSGAGAAVLKIDGAAHLVMERMRLLGGTVCTLDIDWDGSHGTNGGDGLHHNLFRDMLIGNGVIGVRIANAGFKGNNNLFEMVQLNNLTSHGMIAVGASATDNLSIMGGASETGTATTGAGAYYSQGGSIHVHEMSSANNDYDIIVSSGYPVTVLGGRTESSHCLKVTNGLVAVRGFLVADSGGELLDLTGSSSKVSIDAFNSNITPTIVGSSGSLYLRAHSTINTSGFSGTIVQNI